MDYLEQYKILHAAQPSYGTTAVGYVPEIRLVIDYLKPKTVLDFGCGKAVLTKELAQYYPEIEFYDYDPAIPERCTLPIEKTDLVINIDVLEHIPEDILPDVVAKIASISNNVFFLLHHVPAVKRLPNGENAHCTVKPPQWYHELLGRYFKTPHPLPGREPNHSVSITFSPSTQFLHDYSQIISANKKTIWRKIKRLFRKIVKLFAGRK
jgi:SAM-dependent methyltransferase